jgi:hypothetical protein
MEQEIFKLLGKLIIYGGGTAAMAYGLFRFLGEKWIENKFAEKLEAYKHKQQQELEQTRYTINSLFSRVSKIHEKEFEVLPEAWSQMHDALFSLTRFTKPFKQYPNVDAMTEPQLDNFLKQSPIAEFQKQTLKEERNKLEYYRECVFYHELNEVKKACSTFHTYTQKNSIFLSPDLKEYFSKIDDLMWDAAVDKEVGHEAQDREMKKEAWKKVKEEVIPLKNKIEELVQARLRYDRAE